MSSSSIPVYHTSRTTNIWDTALGRMIQHIKRPNLEDWRYRYMQRNQIFPRLPWRNRWYDSLDEQITREETLGRKGTYSHHARNAVADARKIFEPRVAHSAQKHNEMVEEFQNEFGVPPTQQPTGNWMYTKHHRKRMRKEKEEQRKKEKKE